VIVAIDGSRFEAVNNRDKNFTDRKLKARLEQLGIGAGAGQADSAAGEDSRAFLGYLPTC
jgi:hypothetical protein